MKFSFSDRVEVPDHVLVRLLGKELVLLNLDAECYYSLDEIGASIWQVLTAAPNIQFVYEQLLGEFDVEVEPLHQNLSEFLGQLVDSGLLRIRSVDFETAPTI